MTREGLDGQSSPSDLAELLAQLSEKFSSKRGLDEPPSLDAYLARIPAGHDKKIVEVIFNHVCLSKEHGYGVKDEEYLSRYSIHAEALRSKFQSVKVSSPEASDDETVSLQGKLQGSVLNISGVAHSSTEQAEGSGRSSGDEAQFSARYELGDVIGQGGFGTVHRGFDRRLNRPVAIKQTRPDRGRQDELASLKQEALRAAQLQHPGIVTVHDVLIENGRCMIVTELLEGLTLSDWSTQHPRSWHDIATIVAQVADALAHAHSRGVIHRDIKPSNILVLDDVRPVVLDFGLAISDFEAIRDQGQIVGTLQYMSPEQARGEGNQPDGRTDIYSLGVVLYKLLTGRLPHRAKEQADLLWQIQKEKPQPPRQIKPAIPNELETICLKAMTKDVSQRYTTASDLAEELRRFSLFTPSHRSTPTSPEPRASETAKPAPGVLTPKTPGTSSVKKGPERRQLTVLFCGLRLLLKRTNDDSDFEEDQARIWKFRSICEQAVADRHGWLLPSDGRSLTACFGYPTSLENASRLAVDAGLEILQRCSEISSASKQPRLAINTGTCDIGEGEAGQAPLIFGDVVDEVENLARIASQGELFISEGTHSLVQGFFRCESPTDKPGAYRVVSALQAHNRVEAASPGSLTPLIGRSREVDLLKERWENVAEGVGHVILLVGDPGLGKSRLVNVLKEEILNSESSTNTTCIEWFGSEQLTNSALRPAIDCLLRRFGLQNLKDPDSKLDTLLSLLKDLGFTDPIVQAIFASLLSIPSSDRLPELNLTPERLKERILETLLEWLSREASKGPILFIVEDLHWYDPSTLDLLRQFVDGSSISSNGILALFTTRPEFDPPWKGKDCLTQVALTRLMPKQVHQMMAAQAGVERVPQLVVDQIIKRTDGVPLFVEVFTRMLLDAKPNWLDANFITESSSRFKSMEIPATLQDLLIAQLDRVASNREVIQFGAVIGRSFSFAMLSSVIDLDDSSLRSELDKLVGVGILFVKGIIPQSTYTFKHALIQDAAYQLLLKKQRQKFHLRLAETLEAGFPELREEQPELLAMHFAKAGLERKSIQYWLIAGQRSSARSSHHEALDQLNQGLALIETMEQSSERDALELSFRFPSCASLMAVKGYASPEAEAQNSRALKLSESLGPDAPVFHVTMVIWMIRLVRGQIVEGAIVYQELLKLAEASNDDGKRVEGNWAASCNCFWAGAFELAYHHAQEGIRLYQVGPSIDHARFTTQNSGPLLLGNGGLAAWAIGDPVTAQTMCDRGMELADQLKDPFTHAATAYHVALFHQLNGDIKNALDWCDRVITVCTEHAFAIYLGLGMGLKGVVLGMMDHHDQAITQLIAGLKQIDSTGSQKLHQHYESCLAESYWAKNLRAEAWKALDRGFAINNRDEERFCEAELYRKQARFFSDEASHENAKAAFLKAVEVAKKQKAIFFELRAATDFAEHQIAQGLSAAEALAPLRDALKRIDSSVESPEITRAHATLARAKFA